MAFVGEGDPAEDEDEVYSAGTNDGVSAKFGRRLEGKYLPDDGEG